MIWALRRSGFMPFPHGFMFYIIGTQAVVWLVANKLLQYKFLEIYSTYGFVRFYPQVFFTLFAFFVAAAVCVVRSKTKISSVIRNFQPSVNAILGALLVLYIQMTIEIISIDWSVAIRNSEYLMMAGSRGLRYANVFSEISHSANGLCGIASVLILAFLTFNRKKMAALAAIPVVTWHFLFQLAGHSRYAAFFLIAFAAAGVVLSQKRFSPLVLATGVCGLVTLVSVLGGRVSYHHGFSSLPTYFQNVEYRLEVDPSGTFINIFEGGFVSSEHFTRGFQYPEQYKILSLSPLLSSIDGFNEIREQGEKRLHPVVPAGAINEILSFGAFYAAVYFGLQFVAGYLSTKLLARNPNLFSLSVNSLMMFASYLQFTYSTRTVFRLFILVLLVAGGGLFTIRGRSRKGLPHRLRRPHVPGQHGRGLPMPPEKPERPSNAEATE